MKRVLAVAALLAVVAAAVPLAQTNISGVWSLSVQGPQGSFTTDATLTQDGDRLTGKMSRPQGDVELNGTLRDKTVTLLFYVNGPQGKMEVKASAETDGTTMKGSMDFGENKAEFTGTKK